MTESEFTRRTVAIGLTSYALPAAAEVLIHGKSINGAARDLGVTPSVVSRLCKRIREVSICRSCGQVK